MADPPPAAQGSSAPPIARRATGWLAYAGSWAAAAGFWSLAGAASSGMSPTRTLPYGIMAMAVAGLMGIGVWRVTGRVRWQVSGAFYAIHATAMAAYSVVYAASFTIPDVIRGDFAVALAELRRSPVLLWNILMGCWLYLVVAGISYAIRMERERAHQAQAAAEARILAQRAQLTALRAQLNPHFLFNALHTVSALVAHDPRAADGALDRLGDLLRYAMSDSEMVPLSEEWAFVSDYLAFEQLRLGDRLRIVESLDQDAADALLPALVLQPLVENAVRHGVSTRPDGGTVRAEARLEGPMLVVRIADDGPGGEPNGRGDGLGLASVQRRIAAAYGEHGVVRVDSSPAGFAVTLRIPAA